MPPSGEREELARVLLGHSEENRLQASDRGLATQDIHLVWQMFVSQASAILSAGYRRASGWLPISEATRETCAEILGVQFAGGRMMREPFISFWSPTLNKFYCDPTHFMLLPPSPEEEKP